MVDIVDKPYLFNKIAESRDTQTTYSSPYQIRLSLFQAPTNIKNKSASKNYKQLGAIDDFFLFRKNKGVTETGHKGLFNRNTD